MGWHPVSLEGLVSLSPEREREGHLRGTLANGESAEGAERMRESDHHGDGK